MTVFRAVYCLGFDRACLSRRPPLMTCHGEDERVSMSILLYRVVCFDGCHSTLVVPVSQIVCDIEAFSHGSIVVLHLVQFLRER